MTDKQIEFKRVFLKKLHEKLRRDIPWMQFKELSIEENEWVVNSISLDIKRNFYGEQRRDVIKVEFKKPLSWWQHFKEANFPKWLLRKYPVKYQSEWRDIHVHRAFEFPKVELPGQEFLIRDYHDTIIPYDIDPKD